MRIFGFLLLVSVLIFTNDMQAQACMLGGVKNEILNLKDSAIQIEKTSQIEFAKYDPGQFCQRNIQLRFINANPKNANSANFKCLEMSNEELDSYTNVVLMAEVKKFSSIGEYPPWFYSLVPTELAQKLSMIPNGEIDIAELTSLSPREVEHYVEKKYSTSLGTLERVLQEKPQTAHKFNVLESPEMNRSLVEATVVCADLKLSQSFECTKGFGEIMKIATPSYADGIAFTPVETWQEVTSHQEKYSEGLRIMALKMVKKLKGALTADRSSVFDDLVASFREAGSNQKDATNKAFNVLALYGNAGANLGRRFNSLSESKNCQKDLNSICGYMDIIGRAIPSLDFMNSKNGKALYSFPKGINAKCNTNKSYHFWLAAFLSRTLVEKKISPEGAEISVYVANIGYQVNRGLSTNSFATYGKGALEKSTYDPVSQFIRADMAYARSGAAFGAGVQTNKTSIDDNLVRLLKESTPSVQEFSPTGISGLDQIQQYRRFKEIISPQALVD